MQLSCPNCSARDAEASKGNGLGGTIKALFGIYQLRCRRCKTKWETSVWQGGDWRYARCPRCYRQNLTTWAIQDYRLGRWTTMMLNLGATRFRCAPCRCNFASFRPPKDRVAWDERMARIRRDPAEEQSQSEPETEVIRVRVDAPTMRAGLSAPTMRRRQEEKTASGSKAVAKPIEVKQAAPKPIEAKAVAPAPKPVEAKPVVVAPKPIEAKPVVPAPKPVEAKPVVPAPKPVEAKPVVPAPKPVEAKPVVPAPKPVEAKPVVPAPKPVEVKPVTPAPKPIEVKPVAPAPKPVEAKPAAKPVETKPPAPKPMPVPAPAPVFAPAAAARASAPSYSAPRGDAEIRASLNGTAAVGSTVLIKGQISSREDLTIDGEVEGTLDLSGSCLRVGSKGRIRASVTAREVVIFGTIDGDVETSDKLDIRRDGTLLGNIKAHRLVIEEGARVKGQVVTGG